MAARKRTRALERRIARIERTIIVPSFETGQTVVVTLPRVEFLERDLPLSDSERLAIEFNRHTGRLR
jgi:hypothetical protein